MKKINNFVDFNVFFIGIGGISMSGLAGLLKSMGAKVCGSDGDKNNPEIPKLKKFGIHVFDSHDKNNVALDTHWVVYNFAIKDDNPELIRARELQIPIISRAELLGMIASLYDNVIAVAGTHGKTTTTAMISEIFSLAGLNPTIHIGGVSNNLKSNTVVGDTKYLILEACEYHGGFEYLNANIGLVLNIEADHLDYYKDIEEINRAFGRFANRSKCTIVDSTVKHINGDMVVSKDISASNITYSDLGYNYDVYIGGTFWANVRLNQIGLHNVNNSLFAIICAVASGIPKDIILKAISDFNGVERRNELIAKVNDIPVLIDYAHHPSEIKASVLGLKEVSKNPLVIFQPHTYSRTLSLFDEFINVLKDIDNLIIFPTYPAREKEIIGGRAEDLKNALNNAKYIKDINELLKEMGNVVEQELCDLVIILGAGDLALKLKNHFKK